MNRSNRVTAAMAKQTPAEQTATWNHKVLSAMASESNWHKQPSPGARPLSSPPLESYGSHAALRRRMHTAGQRRLSRRLGETRPDKTTVNFKRSPPATLPRLSEDEEDAVKVTPLPSSFAKVEESIAAQQKLLRSMMVEGQKMLQHKRQYQNHYYERSGPQIEILEEVPSQRLALPLSPPSSPTDVTL